MPRGWRTGGPGRPEGASAFVEGFLDYAARHLLPVRVDHMTPEFPATALRHGPRFADVVLNRPGMSRARSAGLNAASTVDNRSRADALLRKVQQLGGAA